MGSYTIQRIHRSWNNLTQMLSKQKKMKKGDIAHLPSGVLLQQMEGGIPFRYHNVKKPASVVVIEKHDDMCRVLFQGSSWIVEDKYLYPLTED